MTLIDELKTSLPEGNFFSLLILLVRYFSRWTND